MAESTGIQWCDASFNPWVGCEKVSPGCAHCYAETLVTGRMARAGTWGADGVRQRTSPSNWKKPLRWAKLARRGRLPDGSYNEDGHRPRVFCASLADVFEDRTELVPWRAELIDLITATHELDWLVLTKRPEKARDWFSARYLPRNVWLGVSIENARHTYRADVLRQIPAAVRFISAEPLLGSLYTPAAASICGPCLEIENEYGTPPDTCGRCGGRGVVRAPLDLSGIDWVIVGGESGPGARPFHLEHAREILDAALAQCGTCERVQGRAGVARASVAREQHLIGQAPVCDRKTAVFVKQLGAKPIDVVWDGGAVAYEQPLTLRDRKGGQWDEWPADLRIREFPRSAAARPKEGGVKHEAFIRMILDGPNKGQWVAYCDDCEWHIDPRPIDQTLGEAVEAHMRETSRVVG